jgi:hypothetical protein
MSDHQTSYNAGQSDALQGKLPALGTANNPSYQQGHKDGGGPR